jgi:hypothetical protein
MFLRRFHEKATWFVDWTRSKNLMAKSRDSGFGKVIPESEIHNCETSVL